VTDFNTIAQVIGDLAAGRMIVLVDERTQDPEGLETVGEGELVMLGQHVTAESVIFMMRQAGSQPVVAAAPERLEALQLHAMVPDRPGPRGAAIMVTVNAHPLPGTGVTARDRAMTIQRLADPDSGPADFVQPGYVTPLRAQAGGVLRRAGHTEAAVDLARLAGMQPVAAMATIFDEAGELASTDHLLSFARRHDLKIGTIRDLIAHRRRTERLISLEARTIIPTCYGEFSVFAYRSLVENNPYIALTMGTVDDGEPALVRMHSACLTGDVLGSLLCDCGQQLDQSFRMIAAAGRGVVVYIQHHEGRGIGIIHKLKAYELQRQGMDTVDANLALGFPPDARDYGLGAQVLYDLGLRRVRFLTNNPTKRVGLEGYGLTVVEQVPIEAPPNPHNIRYLRTKRDRMGHAINLAESQPPDSGVCGHAQEGV
jgi:3,4-dihydroxy 2-butanone 4-phosphate synthase / GTP cyclohydrolase II